MLRNKKKTMAQTVHSFLKEDARKVIFGALEGVCEVRILLARSWRGHEKKRGQRSPREVTILLARSWRGHEKKRGQRSAQRNSARS